MIETPTMKTNNTEQVRVLPPILSEMAMLREWHVIGCKKRGINGVLPIGKTKFYELIKEGRCAKPIKVGRASMWRSSDIAKLIISLSGEHA